MRNTRRNTSTEIPVINTYIHTQVALIQMKEKEISAIAAKIEDEQSLGSKMQKQVITNHDHNHNLLFALPLRKFLMPPFSIILVRFPQILSNFPIIWHQFPMMACGISPTDFV